MQTRFKSVFLFTLVVALLQSQLALAQIELGSSGTVGVRSAPDQDMALRATLTAGGDGPGYYAIRAKADLSGYCKAPSPVIQRMT